MMYIVLWFPGEKGMFRVKGKLSFYWRVERYLGSVP